LGLLVTDAAFLLILVGTARFDIMMIVVGLSCGLAAPRSWEQHRAQAAALGKSRASDPNPPRSSTVP
jgi:hypothetical protein